MSKWAINSWEDIRPSKKEDFDWSEGWNKPDPGRWQQRFAKFRVWLMNLRINYIMNEMFYWMVRESHIRLELEKGDHQLAKKNYAKYNQQFHELLKVRNDYAHKYRVKAHPNQPE